MFRCLDGNDVDGGVGFLFVEAGIEFLQFLQWFTEHILYLEGFFGKVDVHERLLVRRDDGHFFRPLPRGRWENRLAPWLIGDG